MTHAFNTICRSLSIIEENVDASFHVIVIDDLGQIKRLLKLLEIHRCLRTILKDIFLIKRIC